MKDFAIRQLANPTGDQDAVNLVSMKKYVSTTSITTGIAHKQNALAYLTQRVGVTPVNNVVSVNVEDFTSNLHIVNKKAYTFNLVRTGVNSFNSRLALNKKPLSKGEHTICVEFFIPKVDTNWFFSPSTPNPIDTLTYHTKHFNSHSPKYSRTIIHTHKYKDNDNTIYLDITNPGYDGSSPLEKAALIIYGIKGFQADVDGTVYDQSFVIDDGDFTLQTNLDMNDFEIINYDRGYTIVGDTIRLQKDLDLRGYALKNFKPRIIIPGDWKTGYGNYVKFGNNHYAMAPFSCTLYATAVVIVKRVNDSKNYDEIGLNFRIRPTNQFDLALNYTIFKETRSSDDLRFQYMVPVLPGSKFVKINAGEVITLRLVQANNRNFATLTNTEEAIVNLILLDDYSFT